MAAFLYDQCNFSLYILRTYTSLLVLFMKMAAACVRTERTHRAVKKRRDVTLKYLVYTVTTVFYRSEKYISGVFWCFDNERYCINTRTQFTATPLQGLRMQADHVTLSPTRLVIAAPRRGTYKDGNDS